MSTRRRWDTLARALLAGGLMAAAEAFSVPTSAEADSIVVTSTRLVFEQQPYQAVFEDNVVLTERTTRILAKRLKVFFGEDNKMERLEAEGDVVIYRNDLMATGAKASYDLQEGKLQLTGNPRVERDKDTLTGQTVTLWRNSGRILCEPNARLIIASEEDLYWPTRK
ncbi:MAG: hypothetical protein HYV35_05065 [Lentisphaerae bacterium]|nr:hypothetical protein [Lentisphaerota bacterium]